MRIATIGYRTMTGLGYQVLDYVKHLKINKVLVADLSKLNGVPLTYWYNGARKTNGYPSNDDIEWLTDNVDVILLAETPLNYDLYKRAREKGVKTVVVINPEFYDHIKFPQYDMPDMIILPSIWKEEEIRQHAESKGTKVVQLHHPVDRENFPFKQRTTGNPIHIAGKPAVNDRNGTWDFMRACPDGTVTTQDNEFANRIRQRSRHSKVYTNIEQPQQIYSMGDILVLPRKYGGNCLPLNEALSSGMPVIMPDISPNNHILPKEWLVSVNPAGFFEPRTRVDIYQADVNALAERIQWVKENIESQSKLADEIANKISWTTLLPRWEEAIRSVL